MNKFVKCHKIIVFLDKLNKESGFNGAAWRRLRQNAVDRAAARLRLENRRRGSQGGGRKGAAQRKQPPVIGGREEREEAEGSPLEEPASSPKRESPLNATK